MANEFCLNDFLNKQYTLILEISTNYFVTIVEA